MRLAFAVVLALAPAVRAQETGLGIGLEAGLWVEVKGELGGERVLKASSVEVLEPEDEEALIGEVTRVEEGRADLWVLGQRVSTSESTEWKGLEPARALGARVKVEGHHRGPGKFSARSIEPRDGRDRLFGRLDRVERGDGRLTFWVLDFEVRVEPGVEIEHARPLAEYRRTEPRPEPQADTVRRRDDDDFLGTMSLTDDLRLGLRLEYELTDEDEFDLFEGDDEDRRDDLYALRGELIWQPHDRFYLLGGFTHQVLERDDEEDGSSSVNTTRLSEGYAYVYDLGLRGLDLQVGRQDFDDEREWIYDQNLDAVRLIYTRSPVRVELSASTTLSDGSPRDEATDNFVLYVGNDDDDRHVAGYVIDRRTDFDERDFPVHFGVRALGEWIPQNDVWAEYSVVRGFSADDVDLESHGFDVGTTWKPPVASPFYISAGYAFGEGDPDRTDGVDRDFRQTGLQDNNDKFGGVTSFKYYGELFEPELSNLSVLTLGVGARITPRTSLDLVYHRYRQDEAADFLRDTNLDRRPNGVHRDLGYELDLVFGNRSLDHFDFEVVVGAFEPGDAFPDGDTAWLARVQVRFRF